MMPLLIADAGATKTVWSLLSGNESKILRITSHGINPVQDSLETIDEKVLDIKKQLPDLKIETIYYYGAGCASDALKNKVYSSLNHYFKEANIQVESDLLGAAVALFGDDEGIVGILGTGSNTGLYKKGKITQKIPSLGYILGDEGSGYALGKKLLNGIFKKQFSNSFNKKFYENFPITLDELIHQVYLEPKPVPFIASFASFIKDNLDFEEMNLLVIKEFDNFFLKNIIPYGLNVSNNIGLVGSIAYSFGDLIRLSAEKYDIRVIDIIKTPMPYLETYYMNK